MDILTNQGRILLAKTLGQRRDSNHLLVWHNNLCFDRSSRSVDTRDRLSCFLVINFERKELEVTNFKTKLIKNFGDDTQLEFEVLKERHLHLVQFVQRHTANFPHVAVRKTSVFNIFDCNGNRGDQQTMNIQRSHENGGLARKSHNVHYGTNESLEPAVRVLDNSLQVLFDTDLGNSNRMKTGGNRVRIHDFVIKLNQPGKNSSQ
mmetsp:Transcript_1676/g.2271  ORF Transcript_1676/g.2271 Transcript_1676/m.2271 type:complete len:205 (+) Transcript_1676:73-687(+)